MNMLRKIMMLVTGILAVLAFQVLSAAPGSAASAAMPGDAPRSIAPYFTPAASSPKAPDTDGFLRRWLLLEPINKPNRTNAVFTDSYVRNAMNTEYFPNQFTVDSARRRQTDGCRRGTRMACPGFRQFQRQAFSLRLWPEQAGVRRPVLGRYRRQQPSSDRERPHGGRL